MIFYLEKCFELKVFHTFHQKKRKSENIQNNDGHEIVLEVRLCCDATQREISHYKKWKINKIG